jgi:hypothetical protein
VPAGRAFEAEGRRCETSRARHRGRELKVSFSTRSEFDRPLLYAIYTADRYASRSNVPWVTCILSLLLRAHANDAHGSCDRQWCCLRAHR